MARSGTRGTVVPTDELALILEGVLSDRGGVEQPGEKNTTDSALHELAHSIEAVSHGAVSFEAALRMLFRIRARETITTEHTIADLILIAAEQPPWVLRELIVLAPTSSAAAAVIDAYVQHVDPTLTISEQRDLVRQLMRFCMGYVTGITTEEQSKRLVDDYAKRRARRELAGAAA